MGGAVAPDSEVAVLTQGRATVVVAGSEVGELRTWRADGGGRFDGPSTAAAPQEVAVEAAASTDQQSWSG